MNKGIAYHQVGDSFDNLLLIKDAARGVASNGKAFLTLNLGDTSGEIEAKLWDAKKEDETTYVPETIVYITGEVNQFRGRSQLKIMSIRPVEQSEGYSVADFLERAPVEKDDLAEKLTETIFEMENPVLQRIVRGFIKKYQNDLLTYPAAAKNHHEYVSGLAHHIVSMLSLGKQLHQLYPELNKDLLYAGIILHDLGKLKELSGVVTTSYTLEGKMLGHIPMMVEEIGHMARELQVEEEEEVLMLQHLVLSHHGKAEWGSPRPPLIREAELLHLIDMIDAKMNTLNRAFDKIEPGEFTERLFPLDNRSFYKPSFEHH